MEDILERLQQVPLLRQARVADRPALDVLAEELEVCRRPVFTLAATALADDVRGLSLEAAANLWGEAAGAQTVEARSS